mmetsp:Transcript_31839/g.64891  ORF Transcript_31839/g.64891 Transcript_31839/m.64891 type:complete len:371 (+) Transcript_31839:71-1183(+)
MVSAGTLTARRHRDYGEGHICGSSFYEDDNDDDIKALDGADEVSGSVSITDKMESSLDKRFSEVVPDHSVDPQCVIKDMEQEKPVEVIMLAEGDKAGDTLADEPRDVGLSKQSNNAQCSNDSSNRPVALYMPNILCYFRIIFSFSGFHYSMKQKPIMALHVWTAAAVLDLIDGPAARTLHQCSQLGILLDVIADNILRTVIWISSIIQSTTYGDTTSSMIYETGFAVFIICLEWITMFCSQSNQFIKKSDTLHVHWKYMQKGAPFWVIAVCRNNFRTVPGIFAIFGLFVAPFGSYLWYADKSNTTWPARLLGEEVMAVLIQLSILGRLLSAIVESYICYDHFSFVVALDSHDTEQFETSKYNKGVQCRRK